MASVRSEENPFKCTTCDKQFSRKGNLKQHIASVHEGKKPFKCKICDKGSSSKWGMKKHIASVHEGKMPSKCNMCNASFPDTYYLNLHINLVHKKIASFKATLSQRQKALEKRKNKKSNYTITNSIPIIN